MSDKDYCLSTLPSSQQQRKHHSGRSILHLDCCVWYTDQNTLQITAVRALWVVESLVWQRVSLSLNVHYYPSLSASLLPVDAPLRRSSITHTARTSYTISLKFSASRQETKTHVAGQRKTEEVLKFLNQGANIVFLTTEKYIRILQKTPDWLKK